MLLLLLWIIELLIGWFIGYVLWWSQYYLYKFNYSLFILAESYLMIVGIGNVGFYIGYDYSLDSIIGINNNKVRAHLI